MSEQKSLDIIASNQSDTLEGQRKDDERSLFQFLQIERIKGIAPTNVNKDLDSTVKL